MKPWLAEPHLLAGCATMATLLIALGILALLASP